MPDRDNTRLPGESKSAYQAFVIYRDLGPRRTLRAAWEHYRKLRRRKGQKTRGRPRLASRAAPPPSGQWTRWCSQWNWEERAAAHDAIRDQDHFEAYRVKLAEQGEERANQQIAILDRQEESIQILNSALARLVKGSVSGYVYRVQEWCGKALIRDEHDEVRAIDFFDVVALAKEANSIAALAIGDLSEDWHGPLPSEIETSEEGLRRLPGESIRAYEAFRFYRNQGPQRSLRTAYAAFRQIEKVLGEEGAAATAAGSCGHWAAWSRRWQWARRAASYDKLMAVTRYRMDWHSESQVLDRKLDFQEREDDRVQQRSEMLFALFRRAGEAPIVGMPMVGINETTTITRGDRLITTSIQIPGVNIPGFVALHKAFEDTGIQGVGVFPSQPKRRRRASFASGRERLIAEEISPEVLGDDSRTAPEIAMVPTHPFEPRPSKEQPDCILDPSPGVSREVSSGPPEEYVLNQKSDAAINAGSCR